MSSPAHTLSNVVSKLVRASLGASVSESVPDEDLDRHVAELILKEAREKEALYYGKEGLRAYLPHGGTPESNLPKTNKRFLTTMIRSVDEHNTSVIKQQQRAAEEAREERQEEERKERKKSEADVAKERMRRLLGGSLRRDRDTGSRSDRDRVHDRSSQQKRPLLDSRASRGESRRSDRRSSSPLDPDERHWFHPENDYGSYPVRTRRRPRAESRNSPGSSRRERKREEDSVRSRSHRDDREISSRSYPERDSDGGHRTKRHHRDADEADEEDRHRTKRHRSSSKERRRHKPEAACDSKADALHESVAAAAEIGPSLSQPPHVEADEEPLSPSPGPSPPVSKMDRYFEPTYDPRLDIAPISKDGFVEPGQFEGWDHMLAVIKLRKEEKRLREWEQEAEKHNSNGKDKKKKNKDSDKGRPIHELIAENKKALLDAEKKEQGLMDVKYKKRGEARDWDKGKVSL